MNRSFKFLVVSYTMALEKIEQYSAVTPLRADFLYIVDKTRVGIIIVLMNTTVPQSSSIIQ